MACELSQVLYGNSLNLYEVFGVVLGSGYIIIKIALSVAS